MYRTEEMNTSAYLCNGHYFDLGYQNGIVSVNNGIATWQCLSDYSPNSTNVRNCSAPVKVTGQRCLDTTAA